MKLAVFDDLRVGVVSGATITDVTEAARAGERDPLLATWWRSLCRDWQSLRPAIEAAAANGSPLSLESVTLRAPVVNPSKVLAIASNYAEHVAEMHGVQDRTLGRVESWMMSFDVFLKAPSSIVGPADRVVIPREVREAGHEVHHESELVIVIGRGGSRIPVDEALSHIFGYTIGLDITVRSDGDRSRRKSYDTFSPLGPWVTTADESGHDGFDIELTCDGEQRQKVNTDDLLVSVPEIVSRASFAMTLNPGDVIFTGAPPGVGPIVPGNEMWVQISRLGDYTIAVS